MLFRVHGVHGVNRSRALPTRTTFNCSPPVFSFSFSQPQSTKSSPAGVYIVAWVIDVYPSCLSPQLIPRHFQFHCHHILSSTSLSKLLTALIPGPLDWWSVAVHRFPHAARDQAVHRQHFRLGHGPRSASCSSSSPNHTYASKACLLQRPTT